jgi:hypothetical protein
VGVIGVGRIGRVHIESIQSIKDATVVMVGGWVGGWVGGSEQQGQRQQEEESIFSRMAQHTRTPPHRTQNIKKRQGLLSPLLRPCHPNLNQIRWRTSGRRARSRCRSSTASPST